MADATRKPSDDEHGYLERLSDEELRALPPQLLFFLRDISAYLGQVSDKSCEDYAEEIRDALQRHHDLLIIDERDRRGR